jgi:hypothetical protein
MPIRKIASGHLDIGSGWIPVRHRTRIGSNYRYSLNLKGSSDYRDYAIQLTVSYLERMPEDEQLD